MAVIDEIIAHELAELKRRREQHAKEQQEQQ